MNGHGLVLYQQTLHVPLLVRLPDGVHGGRRVAGITRSTDLLPTILHALGVRRALHQRSLVRGRWKLISWYELGPGQRLMSALEQLSAATVDRPKLQARIPELLERVRSFNTDTRQLYDLATDPGEKRNLYTEETVVAAELEAAIVDRESATRGASTAERCAPSQEVLDKLGALGYLITPNR